MDVDSSDDEDVSSAAIAAASAVASTLVAPPASGPKASVAACAAARRPWVVQASQRMRANVLDLGVAGAAPALMRTPRRRLVGHVFAAHVWSKMHLSTSGLSSGKCQGAMLPRCAHGVGSRLRSAAIATSLPLVSLVLRNTAVPSSPCQAGEDIVEEAVAVEREHEDQDQVEPLSYAFLPRLNLAAAIEELRVASRSWQHCLNSPSGGRVAMTPLITPPQSRTAHCG